MKHVRSLVVAAASTAAVTACLVGTMATATAATHYTASSCSGQTNGACYYNSGKTLQAWDRGGAVNKTLKDWAYYRSSTSIGSTIYSASIRGSGTPGDTNCGYVNFFHSANFGGGYTWLREPGGNLPAAYRGSVGSLNWPC